MADPVTIMAGVSIASSVAGGFLGASGAEKQGQAQADAAMFSAQEKQYQAGVALYNKKIAEQNASYASFAGEVEAQEAGMKLRADIGETKATQGASGLDVAGGSPARVRESEFDVGQENIALIRSDAAKKAYGFEVQAFQDSEQAAWDQTAAQYQTKVASYAKSAADTNAAASILGGITSAGSKFITGGQTGMISGGGVPPEMRAG